MINIKLVTPQIKKQVETFSLKHWLAHNRKNKYVYKEKEFHYVAYKDGEMVGHIKGYTNGGVAYLDDIIVSNKHRKMGIGKALLSKFEEIARKNQCHVCLLMTSDKHPEAIHFYKDNGYLVEAILNNMWWNVREYYFVKRLSK